MPSLQQVFDCDQPVALVTGSGAPRVGQEIALTLATAGCRIAVHFRRRSTADQAGIESVQNHCKTEVLVTEGQLEDPDIPKQLVDQSLEHFGRLDIVINSAAIWSPKPLEAVTADDLEKYFRVNATGSFLVAQAAGLAMKDQATGGSIVNIGDWATVRPYLDHAAYFPSKGAVETMTRSLAVELATRNPRIRVNCIQPGPVLFADDVTEQTRRQIAASTLANRTGTPAHIAHAVQFLCENDFITGVCLPVDGGRTIFAPDGLQVGINSG